jgi:hypothetical protein
MKTQKIVIGAALALGSGGSRAQSPSPGAGAAGAAAGASSGTTFMLEGKTNDLRKHVNQQVEVTGRLESASSNTSGTRSGSTDRDATRRSDTTSAGGDGASSPSAASTGQRCRWNRSARFRRPAHADAMHVTDARMQRRTGDVLSPPLLKHGMA